MKSSSWACLSVFLLALMGSSYAYCADKEKAEEGRYALLKNGRLVVGSEHNWTLWRLPDGGVELEDHFQANATLHTFLAGIARMPSTPEVRESLQVGVEPSKLSATFDPSRKLTSLTVSGHKLNGSDGVGLTCKSSYTNFECSGTGDKAKLRLHEPRELLWWYHVPLLLRTWITNPQEASSDSSPRKVVLLSFGNMTQSEWGDKPTLTPAELMIANLGPDTLIVGDKRFQSQKYRVDVKPAMGDPISLTVWIEAQGTILAVEDARTPDDLIALTQYKHFSMIATPVPTTK